jgi:ABC-2 type transport system permease protein
MKTWIAFWNILLKDIRAYYLKPPNISWGLIFPLAWTGMFFIRSGQSLEGVLSVLPGVICISVLFGTTSMLAVTVTFEKKGRSFERLLLSPISLEGLMAAKTAGAVLFGIANAFVPVLLAFFSDGSFGGGLVACSRGCCSYFHRMYFFGIVYRGLRQGGI